MTQNILPAALLIATDPSCTSLLGTGDVDKAAIFNGEGNSVWASSAGFQLSPSEMKAIVNAYKDKNEPKAVQSTGIHIAGEKYVVLKADDTSLYGKKVSLTDSDIPGAEKCPRTTLLTVCVSGANKGREGVVIVKTNQALLVTHYPEHVQAGQAANTVEKLGDYLKSVGY